MKKIVLLLAFAIMLAASNEAAANQPRYGLLFPAPDESVLDLMTRDDIANPDAWWWSLSAGGTIYDARRNILMPRWSPSVEVGRRFGRYGFFFQLELDESFDFTQELKRLDVVHVGVGFEHLAFYGRLRTSMSFGAAILASQTDFDPKGTTGWYVDFRPIGVRWRVGSCNVLELSPLTIDLSIPVTNGIPLVLFSYFTMLRLEFGKLGQ